MRRSVVRGTLADTSRSGAELVVVPNASPFEHGKLARRDALLATRVAESGVALAYVNVVGGQDSVVYDGASVLADADGTIHAAARAFEDQLLLAEFDAARRAFKPCDWSAESDESRESLAWRAVVRATRDYCRKNRFDRVWVGLSGGIDSALVLAIAVDAIGAENVTGVRLPSRYTSTASNDLAEIQANALGIRLETVPIAAPFEGFLEALAPFFGDRAADTAEENLQSRCRGALLMALSTISSLLLTTGNKSEYAVGYATIYGDMCGGFAPIKDLYKTEVFALSRWRNEQGLGNGESGIGKANSWIIPPEVISRPPSAELRENQTDQDSLPPYEVLDAILERYVDQEQSREDIIGAGYDAAIVEKVVRLVANSEWKRQQAAPGPKVSRRAFGHERRYPITSGWH